MIGPDLNKWDSRWSNGIFLGIRPVSEEFFVGTKDGGVIKCRSIRRKIPDQRWNPELLNFKGVPWNMNSEPFHELPSEEQLKPLPAEDKI